MHNANFSSLTANNSKTKEIREDAQKRIQQRLEKKTIELLEMKREHGKLAINEMMKVNILLNSFR